MIERKPVRRRSQVYQYAESKQPGKGRRDPMGKRGQSFGKKQAVVPGSPAHKAGLKEADIILEVNNQKLTEEMSVNDIVQECQIGDIVPVNVLRKGKERILKITLGEKK